MSSPSTHLDVPSEASDASLADYARSQVVAPLRQLGFWSAIALPFLYVPLVATGLQDQSEVLVFLALLVANVLAVAVGHSYTPE